MHFEVDVVVQRPLDDKARRFLADVQRSANRVLRFQGNEGFHGDQGTITVTIGVDALDEGEATSAALSEVARIYPMVPFRPSGAPRPA